MNMQQRAETFTTYVGLALKGAIVERGMSATHVATTMKRSPAAFSRWLNGHVAIPLAVLYEASEIVGVDPAQLVENAHRRLTATLGAPTATVTPLAAASKRRAKRASDDSVSEQPFAAHSADIGGDLDDDLV